MPKRELPKIEGLTKDIQQLFGVLNSESDLAAVLVASGYLDACLGALLESFLRESSISSKLLDARSGALGSFAARADTCYCLGLIPKAVYQDLVVVAEIRNEFAHHHLALNFKTETVIAGCEKLKHAASLRIADGSQLAFEGLVLQNVRNRFVITVVLLAQHLLNLGRSVQRVSAV